MIWLLSILYLIIGLLLSINAVASAHNKTVTLSYRCLCNTLRWMDWRMWLLAIFYTMGWLPIMLWIGIQEIREPKLPY